MPINPYYLEDCNVNAHGKCVIAGRIEVVEDGGNYKNDRALLIVFESPEDIRKALADGACNFKFGD